MLNDFTEVNGEMKYYKDAHKGFYNPQHDDNMEEIIEVNVDKIVSNDESYNNLVTLHQKRIEINQLKEGAE